MNGFIQLPRLFQKKIEPRYYRVCCSECSYTETIDSLFHSYIHTPTELVYSYLSHTLL